MKSCTKCNQIKEFSEFGKSKQVKDGHKSACKACLSADNRLYYSSNIEKESLRKKKQYERDSEKIIAQQLEYYEENKDRRSQWVKDKRKAKPEVFKGYGKTYRKNNRENINIYHKNRRKTDPLYKLQHVLRSRTNSIFKYQRMNKNNSFYEYIGCSLNQLKDYLEAKFQPGMTWKNHSKDGWHIDHIIPLSSAKTEEELHNLCHYTNLQPLWAFDNLSKGAKIL